MFTVRKKVTCAVLGLFAFAGVGLAQNTTIDSFNEAKKLLEKKVYPDHRITIYCNAVFDKKKNITLPDGFTTSKHEKRSHRVEWEHVVPAENFGRAFPEWRDGHPDCVDSKGRDFKGRRCAEKVNMTYRHMQADMYNLYPAIGSVNALRSNINFGMLPGAKSDFGTCQMKIEGNTVEPPESARGVIARTYKYMDAAYKEFNMSRQQKQLMDAWDKMYPVDAWECERARRVEKIQKNRNEIVAKACEKAGL